VIEPCKAAPLAAKHDSRKPAGGDFHFTYHEILPDDSKYLYRVNSAAFEKHLAFISSLTAAPQISFDDGHYSNYENAFPLLEKFGVKATFFLLAGNIGSNKDYLSWEQAREISAAGHRVASHGWSHQMLTLCDASELDEELRDSKKEIENRLGIEVDSISAPGGRWNKRVTDACFQAGYRHFYHSNPWMASREDLGSTVRGRFMVTFRMDADALAKQMELSATERLVLRTKYATKDFARQVLGERLYHQLWCRLANWNPEDGMEVQIGRAPGKKPGLERS
jgi:peptidoglycan/xylan/chitin deacetylase (PgdA/CDA1 family)